VTQADLIEAVEGVQVLGVGDNFFGDGGKGKVVDILMDDFDINARPNGGANAGHTTVINGVKKINHLIPSGLAYDRQGKVNIMGQGMVIDAGLLCEELDEHVASGGTYNNLLISKDAHVVLPHHIALDREKNGKTTIGSTQRGIGPCYEDKIGRRGITIDDLYDHDVLRSKLAILKEQYPGHITSIDDIISRLDGPAQRIKAHVLDTSAYLQDAYDAGKRILIEGSQGALLSIEQGTGKYATGSDCTINGMAAGIGISAALIDLFVGVVKFPYTTKVGRGPFPTKMKVEEFPEIAGLSPRESMLQFYGVPYSGTGRDVRYDTNHPNILALQRSEDPLKMAAGLTLRGDEFGATSLRLRDVGCTDLEAIRYASRINRTRNGSFVILTKVDVLSDTGDYRLCVGYENGGFDRNPETLAKRVPIYETFPGYGDTSQARSCEELPEGLQRGMQRLEQYANVRILGVSNGPERDQIVTHRP
jgi:adenylosuccinate synthase